MFSLLEIFYYVLTSTVAIQTAISVYYSYNLLKNFKKNLNFALLMMFTQPKTPRIFKVLFVSLLIFILGDFVQFLFVSVNGYYIGDFLLYECKLSFNQLLFIFLMQALAYLLFYRVY
ncbi:MAG: hypothetical protein ACP5O8_03450, partial [Candidatus Aenigmatarchaeota archaeon]